MHTRAFQVFKWVENAASQYDICKALIYKEFKNAYC